MKGEDVVDDLTLERALDWARRHSYATGHADTIEMLLDELHWQIMERAVRRLKQDDPK